MAKQRTLDDMIEEVLADKNECTNQEDRLYAFLQQKEKLSTADKMKAVNGLVPPNPKGLKEKKSDN